jgi:hypothetical protein
MKQLEILQRLLLEALRKGHLSASVIDKLVMAILRNPELAQMVRQRAHERRGLQVVPQFDPNHVPGVMQKKTIITRGKRRVVFSPTDVDYCQALYWLLGNIGPIADYSVHADTHAYVKGRGIDDAVESAITAINITTDCVCMQEDIADCFNTVPTGIVQTEFPPRVWNYIAQVCDRHRELMRAATGMPQGHPISAAVINVVINKLLMPIRQRYNGVAYIGTYSDDLTRAGPREIAMQARADISKVLAENGMMLNASKSRSARPTQGQPVTILGYELEWQTPQGRPLIRPRRRAYESLSAALAIAVDLNHAAAIIKGWQNAYRLTNDPRHLQRRHHRHKILRPSGKRFRRLHRHKVLSHSGKRFRRHHRCHLQHHPRCRFRR